MIIDLHAHSRHTPGCPNDPAEAIRRAAAAGLDGICFTDKDTMEGLGEIRALAQDAPIKVFVGLEAITDRGHYLCYFPDPAKVPEPAQLFGPKPWAVREVISRVGSLGGVVVAAHPFDREVENPGGDILYTLKGLAAVEVYSPRRKGLVNEMALEAADHLRLPCVAGSDSKQGLDDVGRAATLFKREVRDEAELVGELKQGSVWPVTVGGQPAPEARADRPPSERGERGRDRGRGRGGRGGRRGGEPRQPWTPRPGHEDLEEPPKRTEGGVKQVELTAPQGVPPVRGGKNE